MRALTLLIAYHLSLITSFAQIGIGAQKADYAKMSALVRQAAIVQSGQHRAAVTAKPVRMTAFVRTTDGAGSIEAVGGRVLARQGDIAIADLPTDGIAPLSALPTTVRIEAGRRAQVLMDTTAAIVNALPAYRATGSHDAFTGRGVVLGLMDVGFDLSHPNFYSDAQATGYRIRAFWDQLSPDSVGSQLPVGRDYTAEADILALGCSANGRTQTHGTHTLGIAAGSGYDTAYRGIAYESDICLVSNAVTSDTIYISPADYYKYTTATDALGFQYLFDYADRVGKPCVASFSEGYTGMNDDDDQMFAEYLNRLSSPGHIIVVAAGNQGHLTTYAAKPRGVQAAGAFVRSWSNEATYSIQADCTPAIHIYTYTNGSKQPSDTLTISGTDSALDSLLCDTLSTGGDTLAVSVSRHKAAFGTANVYQLTISAHRQMPKTALVVEGADCESEVFGSSACQLINDDSTDPRWSAASPGHNILAPAWFPAAICVGSTGHRFRFTNYQGELRDFSAGRTAGLVSPTSSRGPTMDGRTKPDVCAPGDNIVSSYSSYYLEANPDAADIRSDVAHFPFGGRTYAWNSNAGTSMACPVVAGTIALWLQAKPTLTREEIIGILSRTCRQPDPMLTYPNNDYGYGEIDAYRGLLDILGLTKIDGISQHQPSGLRITIGGHQLHIQSSQPTASAATVSIYTAAGQILEKHLLEPGFSEGRIPLAHLPSGIYVVEISSRDRQLAGSTLIRKP
ncbi:MAG: S8 family peptidase [Prevotella sp.]|nr:S8 family peptidase [Prevotella sp.]